MATAEGESNESYLLAADGETNETSEQLLQGSALATPDEEGGYFSNGVGAFLSAKDNVAELTLYVITPAGPTTFRRPSLSLVMPEADNPEAANPATETSEFEDVTLEPGQSHPFHIPANGMLRQAVASFLY